MKLKFWANTDVGRVRGHNEDNFLVDKKLNLFVVCDGMGGHAAGEVASAVCVRSVREVLGAQRAVFENMKKDPGNPNFRKAVISVVQHSIQEACATIWNMAQADASRKGMGTTCSLLLVIGNIGFIGHVGDSRIYLCRGDKIHQITSDHSLVNEMLRLGKIQPGEEDSVPHKNAVTRAVGVNEVVEVDAFEFEFTDGDGVLLCSDGLSGYLESDLDVLDLMSGRDPKEVTEVAIDLANNAGGNDNITAISIRFGGNGGSNGNEKQILKDVDFFRYLTPKELSLVFGICGFETFSSGHRIFDQGADPARLCVLVEGKVNLFTKTKPLKTLRLGDVFAESSVLNASPIRYSAQATENVRVLSIARDAFMELMKNEPSLTVKILWNFVQRFSEMSSLLSAEDLLFTEVGLSDFDSSGSLTIDSEALSDQTDYPEPLIKETTLRPKPLIPETTRRPQALIADAPKPLIAFNNDDFLGFDDNEQTIDRNALVKKKPAPAKAILIPAPQKSSGVSGKSVVKPAASPVINIDETVEIDITSGSFEDIE